MLKFIKVSTMSLLVAAALFSCQSTNKDVRSEARESLETANQPAATIDPNNPQMTAPEEVAAPTGPITVMSFEETEFNFGTVVDGEKVSHSYKFKNTGKEPLILSNAKGSCGCTVPEWPRDPIAPGAEGVITVQFDSKNKKGPRNQKVTITANTNPPQTFIYLKGEVTAPEGETTPQVTQ
ncbi:MAG TPA: DUF1573 domain-containing protein [Saprospiraceae bacterium]|nr:DUF1573 domain-containing protein [Saprospiraceae bacterium]HMQ84277.1 DUF1573 domain-containing protein [Saprospiraceae bacterium]